MKKAVLAVIAALFIIPFTVHAQQQAMSPAANCVSQYEDLTNKSAASLVATGFTIAAAVPGGLWLQKGKEFDYCNAASPKDDAILCWKLREPLKGQPCQ